MPHTDMYISLVADRLAYRALVEDNFIADSKYENGSQRAFFPENFSVM
jgi:hypothetical protein